MASVKLILLDDVEKLGLAGEEVSVAPGYARNYLIPRGLAAKATPCILRILESRKAIIAQKRADELAKAKKNADKIKDLTIGIQMQATEEGLLFGSVTPRMVSDELKAQGFAVAHTNVKIDPPIKTTGDFEVQVKLHAEVTATVKVVVTRA